MPELDTQIRDYLDGTTAPIGARELIMGSTFTEERDDTSRQRRSWRWAWAVVAAAAVVVIGFLLSTGGDGDDVQPIETPPAPTTTEAAQPTGQVEVVEAALAAYSNGDVVGLEALIGEGGLLGWVLGPSDMVLAKMEANAAWVATSPCVESGAVVVCEGIETNDYWGAAGLDRPGRYEVRVEDGLIVGGSFFDDDGDGTLVEYGNEFLRWFETEYPGVFAALPTYDDVGPGMSPISISTSGVPVAGAMPMALQYVGEFVALSPDYPVEPAVSGPEGDAALGTVDAVIEAYNSGNIEAFDELVGLDPSSDPVVGWLFGRKYISHAAMVAGATFEPTVPCELSGVGPAGDVFFVDCVGVQRHPYFSPAGIETPWYVTLTVRDGRVLEGDPHGSYDDDGNRLPPALDGFDGPYGPSTIYGAAFMDWFYVTHPEVAGSIEIDPGSYGLSASELGEAWPITGYDNGIPLPEAMPVVLEYVDEFLAQSPDYPITP